MIYAAVTALALGYTSLINPHAAGSRASVAMTASLERVTPTWEGEDQVKVPQGVLRTNTMGGPWVEQRPRPRRNRKSEAMRAMVRENELRPSNFIYPLFIHDENSNVAIASMPGCERHSLSGWPQSGPSHRSVHTQW